MAHTLIFDLSNVTYLAAYQIGRGVELNPDAINVVHHATTRVLRQMYRQFMPNRVIFACDGKQYWRREIYPEYKANREDTEIRRIVRAAIDTFKQENSKLCLEHQDCEADDVIYALSKHLDEDITIVSTDRDFIQLMSNRIKLYDPKKRDFREMPENPKFELFFKCIRGDTSDNIKSAYPRIPLKRLKSAYTSPEALEKILETKLANGTVVRDNYAFNKRLIDLSHVPEELATSLKKIIEERFIL